MNFDDKIKELFIDLPEPSKDLGNVTSSVQVGKFLHINGILPFAEGKVQNPGHVGINVSLDMARLAARIAAVMTISIASKRLGNSLNSIKRIVEIDGYIACGAEFRDHNKVMDGACELFVQIFGPYGKAARAAVGVQSLPMGACLSLFTVIEIK